MFLVHNSLNIAPFISKPIFLSPEQFFTQKHGDINSLMRLVERSETYFQKNKNLYFSSVSTKNSLTNGETLTRHKELATNIAPAGQEMRVLFPKTILRSYTNNLFKNYKSDIIH